MSIFLFFHVCCPARKFRICVLQVKLWNEYVGKTSTQFLMYSHHIVLINVQYCLWEKNTETCHLVCQLWDENDHCMYLLYVILFLSALLFSESCLTVQYLSLSVIIILFYLCFCQSILQEHNWVIEWVIQSISVYLCLSMCVCVFYFIFIPCIYCNFLFLFRLKLH